MESARIGLRLDLRPNDRSRGIGSGGGAFSGARSNPCSGTTAPAAIPAWFWMRSAAWRGSLMFVSRMTGVSTPVDVDEEVADSEGALPRTLLGFYALHGGNREILRSPVSLCGRRAVLCGARRRSMEYLQPERFQAAWDAAPTPIKMRAAAGISWPDSANIGAVSAAPTAAASEADPIHIDCAAHSSLSWPRS